MASFGHCYVREEGQTLTHRSCFWVRLWKLRPEDITLIFIIILFITPSVSEKPTHLIILFV